MRVLILGASGMLGSAMIRELSRDSQLQVWGSLRSDADKAAFSSQIAEHLISGVDVLNEDQLTELFKRVAPQVAINCIGLVKQVKESEDEQKAMAINALLPHQLAKLCEQYGARFIHFSTDCVFSGTRGNYRETDIPDAQDLYGRSKLLGELDEPNTLTLRTSIIGHELHGSQGLLEWFLSQESTCKGFSKAIFSGLPTPVLASLVHELLVKPDLTGIYHVSSEPISKYNLLKAIAAQYGKKIDIVPSDELVINRSLDSERFSKQTGWVAPSWDAMIKTMYTDRAQHVQK
ncbi:SDR family oxidoreductase [Polynucleobacter sp. AP-Melu-500A-A1]|nr:SDR family oxidoreductase [Polynucleobacter sp. AP-Melu-500A-A1]MBU3630054.1 SDR family oxidoreductase [Polynucleobacter sp. AP-Melu-500A-A1]